jgi:hypothetical protein
MGGHRRKADGRRVVSTEFKRATVQRILTGEKTLAEQPRARHLAECDPKLDSTFIAKLALALSLGSRQIPITQGTDHACVAAQRGRPAAENSLLVNLELAYLGPTSNEQTKSGLGAGRAGDVRASHPAASDRRASRSQP